RQRRRRWCRRPGASAGGTPPALRACLADLADRERHGLVLVEAAGVARPLQDGAHVRVVELPGRLLGHVERLADLSPGVVLGAGFGDGGALGLREAVLLVAKGA